MPINENAVMPATAAEIRAFELSPLSARMADSTTTNHKQEV